MTYLVQWHEKALEDLKEVDKKSVKSILEKIREYLPSDPLALGKALKGNFKGFYRYRHGNYRIVYAIDHAEKTIKILRIGRRKEIKLSES